MNTTSAALARPFDVMPAFALTPIHRPLLIVATVLAWHVAGLWALHSGLLQRPLEQVISVRVIAYLTEAPAPAITPAPAPPQPNTGTPRQSVRAQPQQKTETPRQTAPAQPRAATVAPAPMPLATADPTPMPDAPAGVMLPEPAPPAALAGAGEAAPALGVGVGVVEAAPAQGATAAQPSAPARAGRIELPSSSPEHLNNPRPPYPPLSRRLGEQGLVVVRVFIETDGSATRAEVIRSSGFARLDQAALQTVLKWRYVPGQRDGVPQAMWANVPIHFVLQ